MGTWSAWGGKRGLHLCRLTVRPVSKLWVCCQQSQILFPFWHVLPSPALPISTHTHRMLLLKTIVVEWKDGYQAIYEQPHSLTLSFSHEVEMEFYIPNHEKSHLHCLLTELVAKSLFPLSAPPFSHRRLESKSARQPWPKHVLWTDSFTTMCKWDSLVPTLIIPYRLEWVLETATMNFFFSGGSEKVGFKKCFLIHCYPLTFKVLNM